MNEQLFQDIQTYRQDLSFSCSVNNIPMQFISTWGLFSPRSIDEGSRLLLENLDVTQDDICLDVGCGYGPLGIYMAKKAKQVTMIDKDFVAIDYTKQNTRLNHLNNCEVLLSNGFSNIVQKDYNLIVSNLPAKVGNELLSLYTLDALNHLAPGGRYYVVTITGMRKFIQRIFNDVFGNYKKVKQGKTYTVAMAIKD